MRIGPVKLALATAALALPVLAATPTIPWDEAEKHVGEDATIEGWVMGVKCTQLSCLLAFNPSFDRFTAVIQAASFGTFPPADLDARFSGRKVRVHGKIVENEKKPEIVVASAADLDLAPGEKRKERVQERARAETDILERLTDVIARLEEVTERLAATQERTEAVLAAIEQRQNALAAAQAAQAPPPAPEPSYGEPQPRPAYQALRTVKRGMSRADVQRLIGEPQYVEQGGGGWSTWYYGFGRSISFDARGRAQAMVGFPPP